MKFTRTFVLFVAVCSAASALPAFDSLLPTAEAAVMLESSLSDLLGASDIVAFGTPQEGRSVWEEEARGNGGRRIVSYTRVTLDHVIGGSGKPLSETWVRTLGGQVGTLGQHVDGEAALSIGKRGLLFLKARSDGTHAVVSMSQGYYRLRPGADGVARLVPSEGGMLVGDSDPKTSARALLTGKTEDEIARTVAAERPSRVH